MAHLINPCRTARFVSKETSRFEVSSRRSRTCPAADRCGIPRPARCYPTTSRRGHGSNSCSLSSSKGPAGTLRASSTLMQVAPERAKELDRRRNPSAYASGGARSHAAPTTFDVGASSAERPDEGHRHQRHRQQRRACREQRGVVLVDNHSR